MRHEGIGAVAFTDVKEGRSIGEVGMEAVSAGAQVREDMIEGFAWLRKEWIMDAI